MMKKIADEDAAFSCPQSGVIFLDVQEKLYKFTSALIYLGNYAEIREGKSLINA